jgi:hypothetical protein
LRAGKGRAVRSAPITRCSWSSCAIFWGVGRPNPAGAETARNDYVFERAVRFRHDGSTSPGRIDLYKKGCFVLEAKQSTKRQKGGETYEQLAFMLEGAKGGASERPRAKAKASTATGWDALMRAAKRQAEDYARALVEWPPFIVVVDVGHVIELYANFRRDGKGYDQFPNRNAFRIAMDDLRDEAVRARLKAVWEAPYTLDPAARAAEVTQEIAAFLARMTQSLEARAKLDDPVQKAEHAYKVSKFLMRCIFAMFAEDMGLLPENGFLRLIELHKGRADRFHLAANDFSRRWTRAATTPRSRPTSAASTAACFARSSRSRSPRTSWSCSTRRRGGIGRTSSPPSSARCSNRLCPSASARSSARTTRRAPMWSGLSSRP